MHKRSVHKRPRQQICLCTYIDSGSTTMITHQATPQAVGDTGWQCQIQRLQVASLKQV